MPWFDAGVNLLDSRFDSDATISAAVEAGVEKMCVITTHPDEWILARRLYQRYPNNLTYTLGVHPHHAKVISPDDIQQLGSWFECDGAVAVGECGLDFNRDYSPRAQQIAVFEAHLELAKNLGKPIYLHERDAFDQQLKCIDKVFDQSALSGIAHCFTGHTEQMQAYLTKGLYIGITGWLCDEKRGQSLRQAITSLPLERLILETDAPYLFPKTIRPRQRNNSPAMLPAIGEEFARLVDKPLNDIEKFSYTNTHTLFRIVPL